METEQERSHPTDEELTEFAAMLKREGANFAKVCMPAVAAHLSAGCESCDEFLEELEADCER